VIEETTGMEEAQASKIAEVRENICFVKCFYVIFALQSGYQTFKHQKQVAKYRVAEKSLVRSTFRCIFFDGVNISFGASLVIDINIYI
jgi:hypothetical protein